MRKNENIFCFKRAFKLGCLLLIIYMFMTISFYFLSGEQLHLRESRGNIQLPIANSATAELIEGNIVEQTFTPKIQILDSISIQWGDYYRNNSGNVIVELYDKKNDVIIASQSLDASTLDEGMITNLTLDIPSESLYNTPLSIRITSNSKIGSAVTPLMSNDIQRDGEKLTINGQQVKGTLCFSASGQDYIWTGLHYWEFVVAGVILLLCCFTVICLRCKAGKRSYVVNASFAIERYEFLIKQLVSRDFKTKYKRSVLGVLWSFLNPLLMMTVQYYVFSTIFKSDIENYPVYLLIGIISFNFFSEACGMSLSSIVGNSNLITKVYVPKYIYPLTRVISSVINLVISFIPLSIMVFFTGLELKKSALLSLFFFACLIVFSLGLGFILSSSMVFFRDTQFLWGVFSTIWMYMTPIFYPETILPEEFRGVLQINPLYYFLKNIRMCILDGISPEPITYIQCLLMALIMLVLGSLVFKKSQDRFVLYL